MKERNCAKCGKPMARGNVVKIVRKGSARFEHRKCPESEATQARHSESSAPVAKIAAKKKMTSLSEAKKEKRQKISQKNDESGQPQNDARKVLDSLPTLEEGRKLQMLRSGALKSSKPNSRAVTEE